MTRSGTKHVFLLDGDRIRDVPVKTGSGNWEWVEIIDGLSLGDRVALPPTTARLSDGQTVEVVSE